MHTTVERDLEGARRAVRRIRQAERAQYERMWDAPRGCLREVEQVTWGRIEAALESFGFAGWVDYRDADRDALRPIINARFAAFAAEGN